MKNFTKFFWLSAILLIGFANVGWGQWMYDFGTGTGSYAVASGASTAFFTSTPTNGGTYRVRCASSGNFGSGFILSNPGTTLGTGTELQINSSASASTNKFGVYDWTSPSTVAYVKYKYRTTSSGNGALNFSLGVNTIGNDANGYTSQYNNSIASFTISYTAGAISGVVRRISGSNTTISSSGFSKDSDQIIEVYANNGSGSASYTRGGTTYTLATKTWDLWVDGTRVVTNAATAGTLAAGTNLSGFGFFAESSTSNAAWIYVDDLEYSNSLPITPVTQTSAINFSNVTSTTFDIGWTIGSGSNRAVFMKEGAGTITNPTNGSIYTASNNWGSKGTQLGTSGYYCIYNGSGSSVSLTGLTSGTTYYVQAFEYNGTGTAINYCTGSGTGNPNNATTLGSGAPTKLVITSINNSNIVQVNPSTFSITIQAQDNSNNAQNVTLATSVSLSVATGTGTLAGTTTGTITAGTNSVTISGITYNTIETGVSLTSAVTSGDPLSSGTSSTFTVYSQTPTNQPTSLAFSNVSVSGYTLSYNAAIGTPTGYIILRKQGVGYPTGTPSIGTSYSVNDVIGDGVVAYVGSLLSFTESSLSSGTQYSYSVFSYNGSGTTINYLTTSPLQNQQYTMFAEPTVQTTAVTFSNISATGFTIGWTIGNGSNRLVLVKSGSDVDGAPTDGTLYTANTTFGNGTQIGTGNYVVYSGTGVSVNITGLTEGTSYYVSVFEFNGGAITGGVQNYLTTSPATGNQTPTVPRYYSVTNGDPGTLANWNTARNGTGTAPSDFTTTATFVIQNTFIMATTSTWSFGGTGSILQIENGGTLQANNAITISSGATFQIDNGGTYIHNYATLASSTIFNGTESFASNSNVIINNWSGNTASIVSSVTLPYGNLELNWTGNINNWQQSMSGTVNLCAGNMTVTSVGTGTFRFSAGTAPTVNILGNFVQTAGTVNLASSTGSSIAILNVGGNFSINGGTFTSTSTGSKVVFNGSSAQTFTNAGTISNANFEVGSSSSLNMGTQVLTGGNFTLQSGATIKTANLLGLDGSITVSGTKTLSTGANYEFNGTDAQVTGSLIPSTVNNLTINNSAGVTLSKDITIAGALTLTNGILNTKDGTTLNTLYFNNTATPFTDANETTSNRIVGKAIMNQRTVLAPNPLSFLGVTLQGTTESTDFTIERTTEVEESIVTYSSYNGIKCKWHVSTATTPTIARNVTYKWLQALDNGNDFNSLNAQIWVSPDGLTWDRAGTGSLATGNPRSMQVSTTTFSFWSAADANTPLPVKLASTSTSLFNKRNIDVKWTTTSETNNSGFEIQRQNILDNNWVKTGFVSGNGTTNNTKNYTYTDRGLQTGKYKYRLKQIDYNGNYEYFDINGTVEVGVPSKFDISQNYPNPFNPVTKIDYDLPLDSKVTIKIFDVTGREINTLLNENLKAGYYTSTFNASSFSSGIYFYRMVTSSAKGSNVMTKKMMLIK